MRRAHATAGLALLAGLTTLGLTGCGGGNHHPNEAGGGAPPATSSPGLPGGLAPSSSPPSSAALSPADQKFVKSLQKSIPVVATQPQPFIKVGHATCKAVEDGTKPTKVATTLYEGTKKLAQQSNAPSPLSKKKAKAIVDSSVTAYCPKAATSPSH
jgi:hypothetical protein